MSSFTSVTSDDFRANENTEVVAEASGPVKKSDSLGMKVTARSAIVIDKQTGKILFSKNEGERFSMASLTKIMTGLVVLESDLNLDDKVVIGEDTINTEGANIELEAGEEIRAMDLLYGSLVPSGNDAALSIAKYTAGDIDTFVSKMNQKAHNLELYNTRYANPTGLDDEDHFSTAADLVKLMDEATDNPTFREVIGVKEYEAHALNSDKVHKFENTNKLFDIYLDIIGGKTGFTDDALFCFSSVASDGEGHEIITVVLGSDLNGNQFQDTKALVDWTFRNYSWE